MRRPDARDFGCTNVLVLVGVGMMAMKSVVEVVPFDYVSGSHLDTIFENFDETQLDLDDRHTNSKQIYLRITFHSYFTQLHPKMVPTVGQ